MIKSLIISKPAKMREESVKAPERKWTTGELSYGGLRITFFNVDYENFTHKIVLHKWT